MINQFPINIGIFVVFVSIDEEVKVETVIISPALNFDIPIGYVISWVR